VKKITSKMSTSAEADANAEGHRELPLSTNPAFVKSNDVPAPLPELRGQLSRTLSTAVRVDYGAMIAKDPNHMDREQLVAEVRRLRYEVIDVETRNNARRAFELFDADASGDIDANELREALVMLGKPAEEEDVEQFMKDCDCGETKVISAQAFEDQYVASCASSPRL
jgi:hypothetical protein